MFREIRIGVCSSVNCSYMCVCVLENKKSVGHFSLGDPGDPGVSDMLISRVRHDLAASVALL